MLPKNPPFREEYQTNELRIPAVRQCRLTTAVMPRNKLWCSFEVDADPAGISPRYPAVREVGRGRDFADPPISHPGLHADTYCPFGNSPPVFGEGTVQLMVGRVETPDVGDYHLVEDVEG